MSHRAKILFVLPAFALLACGPDKPADSPGATTMQNGGTTTTTTHDPATPSSGTPAAGAGGSARFATAKGSPVAQPVNGAKADDPLGHGLVDTANWLSPGMAAEGPFYKATLAEKGRAHVDVTLKAGKCYAFIGFTNLATIIDYDLAVYKTDGSVVAEDDDDDSTPTIGKTPMCPTADTPYTVEMIADKGAGDAAFQLFTKTK